jgi:catechol 2,3-dioxygenase
MYSAPVDLQNLLAAGEIENGMPGEAASGTDIGHVHLQAKDIDETTDFYRDVLGLDLMARFGGQASFLSSQDYHHHIGANVWNSLGQDPASPDQAGLTRIVFRVDDSEELDKLRDRLSAAGIDHRSEDGTVTVQDPNGVELVFGPAS